jgi:kinesin family protein 18/19
MLGTENNPGVMYRTLHDLFVEIKKFKGKREYQVSMSYLEIYNELIRDLLVPSSTFLELREDAKGTIQVAGLSENICTTPEQVMDMLHKGNRARTQEPTKANKTSSRSHAVLQVNIKQQDADKSHTDQVRFGNRSFFTLAEELVNTRFRFSSQTLYDRLSRIRTSGANSKHRQTHDGRYV